MSKRFLAAGALCLFSFVSAMRAREVAITIDDLPRGGDGLASPAADPAMTKKLLDPFRREHIPLTGFVNACHYLDEVPLLLSFWVVAGADLGNHTCNHVDLNTTSIADFEADIEKGEPAITTALGHRPLYFRYPYLHAGKDAAPKKPSRNFSLLTVIATPPLL